MRRLLSTLACALALAAGGLLATVPPLGAAEIVPSEKGVIPYSADLPTCGDPSVLALISSRFAEKEAKFWHSDLTIVEYSQITPLAWRPWGLDTIPRRYCTAAATVSNGRRHRVDYSVAEDLGLFGNSWGVSWCVLGLDRNLSYSPSCRMARP